MAFPSVYEAVPGLIEADRIVLVSGRIDLRGRELQIRANEVREPNLGLAARGPAAATPRGRPAGGGVHARRPRQGEGAARVAPGQRAGAGAVPFVERRHAGRGRERPRRSVGRAARRAPLAARRRAPRASATTLPDVRRARRAPVGFGRDVPGDPRDRRGRRAARPAVRRTARSRSRRTAAIRSPRRAPVSRRAPRSCTWSTWISRSRARPRNAGVLRAIAALGARVQAAGAIVDDRADRRRARRGQRRGSSWARRRSSIRTGTGRLIERYGDRLVIGIEVDGDRDPRRAGAGRTDLPLRETLAAVHAAGAARCLITSVARVSTLDGARRCTRSRSRVGLGLPAIVAGGIAIDRRPASPLRDAGAEGAVVGRAALEGRLDLRGGDRVRRRCGRRVTGH